MGNITVLHDLGHEISFRVGEVEVARYVYDGDMPTMEAPKPYFHPIRTLDGAPVSCYRPHDHRWHKGLSMTLTDVSGYNFWGGPTFVDGEYRYLDNLGVQEHDGFDEIVNDDCEVRVTERLTWCPTPGQKWLSETRRFVLTVVDRETDNWTLDFATDLRNDSGSDLNLGSPTTAGRELAGYTGLFWRGPRGFTGGDIYLADGRGGEESMGQQSPWLAFAADHDERDGGATLLWFNSSDNPPTHWFVRTDPFAAVAPSPAFFETLTLPAGDTLRLRHRMVIVSSRLDRDGVDRIARRQTW